LKENPLLKGCRAKIPNLELFDEEITKLKHVQSDIEKILTPVEIFWLRINLQPLKTALERRVREWVDVYTGFLVMEFKMTLNNFKEFIKKTKEGIQKNPADPENAGDQNLLMNVMKVISDMKDVDPKHEQIITRMKEMVAKLKKHNVIIIDKKEEDPLQSIDNIKSSFTETAGQVFKVKADIIQFKDQEAQKLKEKLKEFNESVNEFRKKFLAELPFNCRDNMTMEEIKESYVKIMNFHGQLRAIEVKAQDYNQLEKLFELQKSNYKPIKECTSDLRNLKTMWDTIAMVNYQYSDWKSKTWRQIKADVFLEINKTLANQIKTLPKEIRSYKGYNVIVD
jgi:dynein heavy chain, axonemal